MRPQKAAYLVFESATPAIVKSIKQRDFLGAWLRLRAQRGGVPRLNDFKPERFDDETKDTTFYTIEHHSSGLRFRINSNGSRLADAYGAQGGGQLLDEYLGQTLADAILPIYRESVRRGLPSYSISMATDVYERSVAWERLLLPFADDQTVSHIMASIKTISEDGSFEIKNLMRGHRTAPVFTTRAIIDTQLTPPTPRRTQNGDSIELV